MKTFSIMVISIAMLTSCNSGKVNQDAEAKKLMELTRQWGDYALKGDVEKTLGFWADDAAVMSPNTSTKKGQGEIRKMVEGVFSIPGFEITFEPKEAFVSSSGDIGYTTTYHYFSIPDSLGNKKTTFGKGVEIWKKQSDGSWKIIVDIYNADPTIKSLK